MGLTPLLSRVDPGLASRLPTAGLPKEPADANLGEMGLFAEGLGIRDIPPPNVCGGGGGIEAASC